MQKRYMDIKLTYRFYNRLVLITGLCLLSLQPSAYKMATPGYMALVHVMTGCNKVSLPSKATKLYKRCSFNRDDKKNLVDQSRDAGTLRIDNGGPPLLKTGTQTVFFQLIPLPSLRPLVLRI